MQQIHDNILETIGRTPMVRLNHLSPNPRVEIVAKVEGFNPTGSIKDRIALKMIEQAEASGALTKDKTIIEPTSGNTGIGLAMIGAVKTAPDKGTDGAICRVRELLAENSDKYFNPNQFSNEYNKLAHYTTTAEEIWEQTGGKVTHMVSSLGTSGTIMGIGMGLKSHNPDVQIVEAHPVKGHYIQGLKNIEEAIVPAIYDPDKIDTHIMVESEIAFEYVRQIVKKEGIFVGMSSGAAMYAACEVAKTLDSGLIVVIFPDRGEKYLSTDLFKL